LIFCWTFLGQFGDKIEIKIEIKDILRYRAGDLFISIFVYARSREKSRTGSAQVRSSNNRLQIVFTFEGKRYFISTGLSDTPYSRKQAQDKALEVERDIAYGEFDPDNLDKYKLVILLSSEAALMREVQLMKA
jgi:hypothetical protein